MFEYDLVCFTLILPFDFLIYLITVLQIPYVFSLFSYISVPFLFLKEHQAESDSESSKLCRKKGILPEGQWNRNLPWPEH